MRGPSVRAGQCGNASLTCAANNQSKLLDIRLGRLVAPAPSGQRCIVPLVIWNLQVL